MATQSTDSLRLLPRLGQLIEVQPVKSGSGYASAVLHVSDTGHIVVDLPPLGTPVSLRTPRNSQVVVRFSALDGSPVAWRAVVRAFGNWGVGLVLERPFSAD